jgi:adenosylhomocysteine nucleosidase
MSRIAIIAALPKELKPLVKGWSEQSANGVKIWHHREGSSEWIAACAGMGVDAATRACAEVAKNGGLDALFSIGWAGALQNGLIAGQAYRVAGVIDGQTGERIRAIDTGAGQRSRKQKRSQEVKESGDRGAGCGGNSESRIQNPEVPLVQNSSGRCAILQESRAEIWLVTIPRFAVRAEKARLASLYRAALVDMEAFALARVAATQGIPFYCIKAISDGHHERLPDFNRFVSSENRFRLIPFIFFAFLRPWLWPALMRLGAYSNHAARDLRRLVLTTLEERMMVAPPSNSGSKN